MGITVTGSAISSADCPVCGGKKKMYQEVSSAGWLLYMCRKCGYGNYFTCKVDEAGYVHALKWDRRHERNNFAKFINVKLKHRLPWTGKTLFYPLMEDCDGISIRPITKMQKLRWRAYYYPLTGGDLFIGYFKTFGEAWVASEAFEAAYYRNIEEKKGKKQK